MIKLVSIYHHFIPSAGFGGFDFCCMNVNHEVALNLICFSSQKNGGQNAKNIWWSLATRWQFLLKGKAALYLIFI